MKQLHQISIKKMTLAFAAIGTVAWAVTGIQVGPTGKTYASADIQCSMNPVTGMAPMVQAGLYNPKKGATAAVSQNGVGVANVTFASPDTTVWLTNGVDNVDVAISKRSIDTYQFDASLAFPGQPNVCIPDTRGNKVDAVAGTETAASGKSTAVITPGCAVNPATGRPQPFVNLLDNGTFLLNVSVNNVPLTQIGRTRYSVPVFLSPGLNVISAAEGTLSTDYYIRNGGTGTCTL
jgi:beta-glucanase (GH16 family)